MLCLLALSACVNVAAQINKNVLELSFKEDGQMSAPRVDMGQLAPNQSANTTVGIQRE